MKTLLLMSVVVLCAVCAVLAGTAENPENGDKLITVRSENPEIVTVSDLYSYSGPKCTGTKTTHLAKGDSNDDVHIVPYGSKNFYLGQCESYTISYMYQGKEIEQDVDWAENTIRNSRACFDSSFGGLFAVDYDVSGGGGALPALEVPQLIGGGGGHIVSGAYDWITFYNTTASGGMIERDASGNPISPVLPDGSLVTAVFLYDVVTFEVVAGSNCPPADLTGDCFVDYEDFALMADQWLTGDPCAPHGMVWVDINDPGVPGHEGFNGEMSKYETTNAQYCEFLNAAIASGDIYVNGNTVYGSNGSNGGADFVGETYFDTYAASLYSQITFSGGVFSVRRRDGYSMADHPVVEVSWYGATAFCNYYGYRLPTEWEWQGVADYNGSYTYGCGTSINSSKANYYLGSGDYCNPLNLSSRPYTSPVDHYSSYGYGMNDIAGNAWEWTSTPGGPYRVLLGGSWYVDDYNCTVSTRYYYTPDTAYSDIGFRVCR